MTEGEVAARRGELGVTPVYKRIDTCAAEFPSPTPYMYSCYEGDGAGPAESESDVTEARQVVILGCGPNRIGHGIEFSYCSLHAVSAFSEADHDTTIATSTPKHL